MGTGPVMSGTMRMQHLWRQILVFTDSPVRTQPPVMLPKVAERFDANQALTDASPRHLVARNLAALPRWFRARRTR